MRTPLAPALLGLLWSVNASAGEVAELLRERIAEFDAHARFPLPTLDADQLERLEQGRLVRVREARAADAPQRVLALQVLEARKEVLWVAARDAHYDAIDSMTHVLLDTKGGREHWYQLLDLPFPFADRHWIIEVWDNHPLAHATGGVAWEHPWRLLDGGPELARAAIAGGRVKGITPKQGEDAVYVPVNRGAWIAISLPGDRALLGYHVTSVVGGAVPDRLVADYTMMTFDSLFKGIGGRIADALQHYDQAHEPMPGADGRNIAPFR